MKRPRKTRILEEISKGGSSAESGRRPEDMGASTDAGVDFICVRLGCV